MAGEKSRGADPRLVGTIVAGYLAHHNVAADQIPELIGAVHRALAGLGAPAEAPGALTPAVPPRRSVQRDVVVCLECGWQGKMLRRHLGTRHGLSADAYLRRWNLPSDHPLTAPSYSARRSALARQLGLGRGDRPGASAGEGDTPRPRRGRPRRIAAGDGG